MHSKFMNIQSTKEKELLKGAAVTSVEDNGHRISFLLTDGRTWSVNLKNLHVCNEPSVFEDVEVEYEIPSSSEAVHV